MPCAEWYTSVDSRQSTVELKSKAFLAVDPGACYYEARTYGVGSCGCPTRTPAAPLRLVPTP
eukprot:1191325-Prorocentrum_minimum.AAC.1